MVFFCLYLDVIASLKSGGSAVCVGNSLNLETSLSPNNLSQLSTSTTSIPKFEFTDIFSRLRPEQQFGPKGTDNLRLFVTCILHSLYSNCLVEKTLQ